MQIVAYGWLAGGPCCCAPGSGCDLGDGAPVTPGPMCSWITKFEPTADTVSENRPPKLGSIEPSFAQISALLARMLCEGVRGPLGIEDFAASGPELVAWALVSPPLAGSAG